MEVRVVQGNIWANSLKFWDKLSRLENKNDEFENRVLFSRAVDANTVSDEHMLEGRGERHGTRA